MRHWSGVVLLVMLGGCAESPKAHLGGDGGSTGPRDGAPTGEAVTSDGLPDGSSHSGHTIPGTIEAEDFDEGGEGVAYHDADPQNKCNADYRPGEGVDIKTCTDTGGGYAVGWTEAGEWINYTVTVKATASYDLQLRVATAETDRSLHLELDGTDITGTLAVPVTGPWDTTYTSVGKTGVALTQGTHVLRIVFDTGAVDVNALIATAPGSDPCSGVTCSGHGTCSSNGGAPTCTCDPGYQPSGTSCIPAGTGAFVVQNGQIIGPNGQPFVARGINVYTWLSSVVSTSAAGAPLVSTFPGINMVRLNSFDLADDAASMQTFVSQMSKLGIVVEIEYHNYPNVPTGANLTSTASWYAGLASAFNGNPYVWFGSQNEPADPASAVTAMHVAVYNAIRATGNNTIIMHNLVGGYTTNGLTPSAYSSMTNIVWDCHYYNWISSYATDLGANATALGKEIADAQSITSADGTVPVIIGEYGDSTDGENVDPGWVNSVQAVLQSGYGTLAWHWNPGGGADWLLDPPFTGGQSQLTAYGQMVANFIAGKP